MFHISDWLPTFTHLAGVKIDTTVDGKNIWDALSLDKTSPRNEILGHLNDVVGFSSYIRDNWKYVNGSTQKGKHDDWLGDVDLTEKYPGYESYGEAVLASEAGQILYPYSVMNRNELSAITIDMIRTDKIIDCNNIPMDDEYVCNPLEYPCLFNIINDPCERKNLAYLRPNTLKMMQDELEKFRKTALPPRNQPSDP